MNSSPVLQALTALDIDSMTNRHVLYDVNLRRAPSGDTMAFLTFDRLSEADACMEVFRNWWQPCPAQGR